MWGGSFSVLTGTEGQKYLAGTEPDTGGLHTARERMDGSLVSLSELESHSRLHEAV